MRTEARFLLAIGLMLLVILGTNYFFPIVPPELPPPAEAPAEPEEVERPGLPVLPPPTPPEEPPAAAVPDVPAAAAAVPRRAVVVESPIYRYEFSNYGAVVGSIELPGFVSLRTDEPVDLVPEGASALGHRVVVRGDTLDLSSVPFEVSPPEGLTLREGEGPQDITFTYRPPAEAADPAGGFVFEVRYTFRSDSYMVDAQGSVRGVERPLVLTRLGRGLSFNEADSASEARMMAFVSNHVNEGIRTVPLAKVDRERLDEGPFLWAAFKSKFFVGIVMTRDLPEAGDYLGGVLMRPEPERHQASVSVAQVARADGTFAFRLLFGPQNYAELTAVGNDLQEVNPYGWRFFRPVVRPFVAIITTVLIFMHQSLGWGYGWVLVLFGVLIRILLWPLNQKAMKAQMRNMAVQPLVKEIQAKYKDNPERMQKEMMRLYKEYGFNPMAGCLPMLLPWPVLIALFFVFQNTIEFRGVPFLWLPDLSAPDPFYLLPIIMAVSLFLMQYISYRSMDQDNPQMKMMMWFLPIFLGFLFMQFAAGVNLYYAVSNIATIPQQYLIAKERKKVQARGPLKLSDDDEEPARKEGGGAKPPPKPPPKRAPKTPRPAKAARDKRGRRGRA